MAVPGSGVYLYFGSALNGLNGRIQRHLRGDKKIHWHIDYLTSSASIEQVWCVSDGSNWECCWATEAAGLAMWVSSVAGFGSSDWGCGAHLHASKASSDLDAIRHRLHRACSRLLAKEGTTTI